MNKLEIVKVIAEESGLTQKEVTGVVDTMINTIISELKRGEEVKCYEFFKYGFANFTVLLSTRLQPD